MRSLQDWVYEVEAGSIRLWLVRIALVLLVGGLAGWIGLREFNGLRSMEAMDFAQQGRQLAQGKGFTTLFVRPLALWQLRAKDGNQAPPVYEFPETLTPPLYPLLLAGLFRGGQILHLLDFEVSPESVKSFRIYTPDYVPLVLNLLAIVAVTLVIFLWGSAQFDIGVGLLAGVFFLGSANLWDLALEGGCSLLVVLLYASTGYLLSHLWRRQDGEVTAVGTMGGHFLAFFGGILMGVTPLVQVIHIWPVLVLVFLSLFFLGQEKWSLLLGALIPITLFLAWLGKLWVITGNPLGLNWAYFLNDSANYPGNIVWRTFSFDVEKTDVWRRSLGSVLRGGSILLQKGPMLCGSALAGILGFVTLLHRFRLRSATMGRNIWGGVVITLLIATAFVVRSDDQTGIPILITLLPVACVYGSAFLWILVERLKLELDLLGKLIACMVGLLALSPTVARLLLPEPPPFAFPPNYPPIFIFMRSWFEPNEFQASDLPWAESWYANTPTLWLPTTREDFLKIHDRITPVLSILFTPMSSDVKMYSQMLSDNSEWKAWADLIRRQEPPDLPQAFATSLPPNNDYLLLSIQKRWN